MNATTYKNAEWFLFGGCSLLWIQFSSIQSLSSVWLFATQWTVARQASLSITNSRSLPKLISIQSVKPFNHLILCRPLPLLPSIFSSIKVFSNESALCIKWTKYWSFSFNISLSKEHPGLIFLRMDWLDLLAVPGTLKSLLQHHSSKASILLHSAFFIVQLSHPYMTAGKTIALTRRTFVDKVMVQQRHVMIAEYKLYESQNALYFLLCYWFVSLVTKMMPGARGGFATNEKTVLGAWGELKCLRENLFPWGLEFFECIWYLEEHL